MEKIKPEQAVEILRKQGMEVTVEEAKLILEFLRKFAAITVSNYLKK